MIHNGTDWTFASNYVAGLPAPQGVAMPQVSFWVEAALHAEQAKLAGKPWVCTCQCCAWVRPLARWVPSDRHGGGQPQLNLAARDRLEGCRACGSMYGHTGTVRLCTQYVCMACKTMQCWNSGSGMCKLCYAGYTYPADRGPKAPACQRAGCLGLPSRPAMAVAVSRKKAVCATCALTHVHITYRPGMIGTTPGPRQPQTLHQYVQARLAERATKWFHWPFGAQLTAQ